MSQSGNTWLKAYYGKDFDTLNPSVVLEGKHKAVVQLKSVAHTGEHSTVAYVLIDKQGRHNVTRHLPLHEGIPSPEEFEKMKKIFLEEEDR